MMGTSEHSLGLIHDRQMMPVFAGGPMQSNPL